MIVTALALLATTLATAAESRGERVAEIVSAATDDPFILRHVRRLVDAPPTSCQATRQIAKRMAKQYPVDTRTYPATTADGTAIWCDHRRQTVNVEGRRQEEDPLVRLGYVAPALAAWTDRNPSRWSLALRPSEARPLEVWGVGSARDVVYQAIARGLHPDIIQSRLNGEQRSHVLVEIPSDAGDYDAPVFMAVTPGSDGSIEEVEFILSRDFSRHVGDAAARPMAVLDGDDDALARLRSWWRNRSGLVCISGCADPGERMGALFGEVLSDGQIDRGEMGEGSGRFFVIVFETYPDVPRVAVHGDWEGFELRTGSHPTYVLDDGQWVPAEPMVVDAELGVLLSGPNPLGLDRLPVSDPDAVTLEGFDQPIPQFTPSTPSTVRAEDGHVGQLPGGRQQTTIVDWVELPHGYSRLPTSDDHHSLSYIWGSREGDLAFLGVKDDTVTLIRRYRFDRRYRRENTWGGTDSGAAKLGRFQTSQYDAVLVYNGSEQPGELGYVSLKQESDAQWAQRREARQREIDAIYAARERERVARAAVAKPQRTLMETLIEQRDRFYTSVTVTNTGVSPCAVSVYSDSGVAGGSSGSLQLAPGASETLLVDVSSSSYAVGSSSGCHEGVTVR